MIISNLGNMIFNQTTTFVGTIRRLNEGEGIFTRIKDILGGTYVTMDVVLLVNVTELLKLGRYRTEKRNRAIFAYRSYVIAFYSLSEIQVSFFRLLRYFFKFL